MLIWHDGKKALWASKSESKNSKTGNLMQLAVIPLHKGDGIRTKHTCGNCPLRAGNNDREEMKARGDYVPTCYVDGQPVASMIRAVGRALANGAKGGRSAYQVTGRLKKASKGRLIRSMMVGDAGMLPPYVRQGLADAIHLLGGTGYTHTPRPELMDTHQASCHTLADKRRLNKAGWKTFRIVQPGEQLDRDEIECLADTRGMTCEECQLCDGTCNVAIIDHGPGSKARKSA